MKLVVADAGSLIGLASISRLYILRRLYQSVTIPRKVFDEITATGEKPGAKAVSESVVSGWTKLVRVKRGNLANSLSLLVDAGEAEAIQLAMEQNADMLLIDDRKGRSIAKKRGIKVVGTGGVLINAKKAGLLEKRIVGFKRIAKRGVSFVVWPDSEDS